MQAGIEFIPGLALLGMALLLLLVPPIAVIAVIVLATATLATVVALAGAVLATPFLLAGYIHRRLADRHPAEPSSRSRETHPTRVAALTELTTAGR